MPIRAQLALVAAALVAATATATPAHAAPVAAGIPLPFTAPADVVSAGDRVFVSGGADSTTVVVTDADGAVVGTLPDLPGPTDLLVSPNRRTLYVALPGAGEIAAFDTGSLRESARYETGECPSSLALTGRSLWFGYGCDQWGGNIGRVNLARQPATVSTGLVAQDFHGHPLVTASRGVLLAGQPNLSPSSLYPYTIGPNGMLTPLPAAGSWDVGSNLADVALNAAGTTVYTAAGFPYQVQAFPLTDYTTPTTIYPTESYPAAVELSRDGTLVAAGADASYDPDVSVYTAAGDPVATYEFDQNLIERGLAWAPDGRRLYAVAARSFVSGETATLHVLALPRN